MKDTVVLRDTTLLLNVHTADRCAGQHCCIHNPSNHHMLTWEPQWNAADKSMWRVCPHGLRHPDPDDLRFQRSRYRTVSRGLHGCDGCCQPHVQEIEGGNNGNG